MIKLFLCLMFLGGCVHSPVSGNYNHDDVQDKDCYESYGGQHGYCDARSHEYPRGK